LLIPVSLLMIRGHHVLKIYVIVELLLAAPSAVFFILVLSANLSPAHGFSVRELIIPVSVFAVFTSVPLSVAIALLRKAPEPKTITNERDN